MSWYHVAQVAVFVIAAALAWETPRAARWLGLLAASYVISVFYVHVAPVSAMWPPSQLVSLLLDGIVIVAVREWHKHEWEKGIIAILAFMVTANLLQLFGLLVGFPPALSHENFGIVLEFLNYLAAALAGGVGLRDRIKANGHGVAGHRPNFLHRPSSYAQCREETYKSLRKW